jgi:TRAP-type C4-dicarboxylate transport system substrate-binding protein
MWFHWNGNQFKGMKESIMKRIVVLALAVLTAGIYGALPETAHAAEFNIRLSTYLSPNMAGPIKEIGKDLEVMSNGRIKVTAFAGGELVSSSDSLKAVKSGVIQIAHGSGYHWSESKFAPIEAGMPMTWASAVEADALWDQLGFFDIIKKGYDELGVHYLGPAYMAPYAITTKKPVKSIEDLKKMKIRASTGPAKMFAKLGISTVYMKPEELYLALSTGTLDGVLYGGAIEYKELSFPEVAPYYCSTFILNPITDAFIINKKFYAKLPADLKRIVDLSFYKARWNYYIWVMAQEYETRKAFYPGKVTTLSATDVEKLTEAAQIIWDEEAKGSPLNEKLVNILKNFLRSAGRLK